MEIKSKEDLKQRIEGNGLVCDCGQTVYRPGSGAIEAMQNYNPYFEYIECTRCHKLFYL